MELVGMAALFGPSVAFILVIVGILAIYSELIFPSRIYPGALGALAVFSGVYWLWRDGASVPGFFFLAGGLILFLADAIWSLRAIPGILGALSFTGGSVLLFPQNVRYIWVVLPVSFLFSIASLLLTRAGRRARENKWAAIPEED